MTSCVLPIPEEQFDIGLTVSSGQTFRWKQLGDTWVGVVGCNIIELKREQDNIHVNVIGPWESQVEDNIRSYFHLDTDIARLHQFIVSKEPRLKKFIQPFKGLRVLNWMEPEECLLSFICTPSNNIPRITGMIDRLCRNYGSEIATFNGETYYSFPSAAVIADIPETELRKLGFGFRARTIINASKFIIDKSDGWLQKLMGLTYIKAHAELCQIPGVGSKIADCASLFGLNFTEAAPIDTHLWQAVGQWLMPELSGTSLTPAKYAQVSEWFRNKFGDTAGWAHQYLFYAHLKGYEIR